MFRWNVTTTAAVALVCFLVGATTGWKVNTWKTDAEARASMERALEQAKVIAEQDAAFSTELITITKTIWKEKSNAHDALDAAAVTDCGLDPAGLRAVQSIYEPDASRAGATVDLVRSRAGAAH